MPESESTIGLLGDLCRALPDPLLLVDPRGRIHDANPPACRLLQQSHERLVGGMLGDLVTTAPELLGAYLRNCSGSRQPVMGALGLRNGSGTLRSEGALVVPRSDASPALIALRLRNRDATTQRFRLLTEKIDQLGREVSHRVRAESILEAQRRGLELIASGAPLGQVLAELTCAVEALTAEDVVASILLLDLSGRHLVHGAGPSLPAAYKDAIDGIAIGPEVGSCGTAAFHNQAVVVRDIATDPLWKDFRDLALAHGLCACWSTPIRSRDGDVLGTFALYYREPQDPSRDSEQVVELVTRTAAIAIERRREEDHLHHILEREREARAAAESADRAKDDFLALVSHELRNPLNAMLGWTRLLQGGKLDPETFARGIETVERNAEVQAQLINDLLDFSRLSTGKFSIEPEATDLARIVGDGVDSLGPAAVEGDLKLEFRCEDASIPIVGDPDRLQQVVSNLVGNAIKFTPAGGRILVRCKRTEERAQIIVEDSGRGIPEELLAKVFERFRQGDASLSRDRGGLGLGLAVVRHIVERHHGTVRAESEGPGCGSTFTVQLPLGGFTNPGATMQASEREPQLENVRILVVDDNPDARDLVETTLRLQGASVTSVGSGEEALERLRSQPFEVLISDIGMPGIDGYALLRRVRREGSVPTSLRALALTAYASDRDRAMAAEVGYDAHLAKPFEPGQLLRVVKHLVRRDSTGPADTNPG